MAMRFGILRSKLLSEPDLIFKRTIFKSKPVVPPSPYVIVRATPNDNDDIIKLMWDSYHPDEPTTQAIGLGRQRNSVMDEEALKVLAEGKTMVAKCKYDGHLVGACLNSVANPWDHELIDKLACTVLDQKVRHLYHFWAYLQRAPDIYQRFCTNCVFELDSLFVKKNARGKGLAIRLAEASKEFGLDCGYNVLRMDCTNFYSAKIAQKLKFHLLQEIPYCSYLGQDNMPLFKVKPPHQIVRIYVFAPYLPEDYKIKQKEFLPHNVVI